MTRFDQLQLFDQKAAALFSSAVRILSIQHRHSVAERVASGSFYPEFAALVSELLMQLRDQSPAHQAPA